MGTTLQIRSIDESLAEAAKAEAARRHLTVSDYLKELIAADLDKVSAAQRRQVLYAQIADQAAGLGITREDTTAALAQAREEMQRR